MVFKCSHRGMQLYGCCLKTNNSGNSGGTNWINRERVHLGSTVSFMLEVTETFSRSVV